MIDTIYARYDCPIENQYQFSSSESTGLGTTEKDVQLLHAEKDHLNIIIKEVEAKNNKSMRRPNIGLRESSKSHIKAQQMINASRNNRQSSTVNTDLKNNSPPVSPSAKDEQRYKQCPQCDAKLFYKSGVNTHLAHAHGIPTWPPDIDMTETSKQMPNNHTGFNKQNILGSNESTMQGTNSSGSNPPNGQTVLGRNIEIMQGINNKEPHPLMVDADLNMIGINNVSNQCVKGINTTTPTTQDTILETDPTTNTEVRSSMEPAIKNTVSSSKTTISDSALTAEYGVQTSTRPSSTSKIRLTEEHKHRPKPKGKHKCPKLPSPTSDTNTSPTPKPVWRSEFITVTYGL